MRVDELMTTSIQACTAGDSLGRAAQQMWNGDCGCLPVVDADGSGRVVGIITDRDVCMSALFQGKPLSDLRVADAMTTEVRTCRPADAIFTAEGAMSEARVRRLPVVNDNGVLVGMLGLADLAREAARQQCSPHQQITGSEVGITLASICR